MSEFDFGFGCCGYGELGDASAADYTEADLQLSNADIATGWIIVQQFFHYASAYPSFQLSSPIDIVNFYKNTSTTPFDANSWLEGIGLGANLSGMSTGTGLSILNPFSRKTSTAMQALADAGQGQIPARSVSFSNYLSNIASADLSAMEWIAAVPTVLSQTVREGGQLFLDTSTSLYNVAKILPYLVYPAAAFLLYGVAIKYMNKMKKS